MCFWKETLHVSDSSSVHHQEFFTVHTAVVYVIQVCWQLASSKPVWHIPMLCVQWKTPDDGQRNCPKHVKFHSKNKFEKLVHLVGFTVRNLSQCMVTRTSKINNVSLQLRTSSRGYMWKINNLMGQSCSSEDKSCLHIQRFPTFFFMEPKKFTTMFAKHCSDYAFYLMCM